MEISIRPPLPSDNGVSPMFYPENPSEIRAHPLLRLFGRAYSLAPSIIGASMQRLISRFLFAILPLLTLPALAEELLGQPTPGGLDLQQAASPVKEQMHHFHDMLLWIIVPITLLVLGLMIWVVVRYNKRANPVPSKVTHNTTIEVVWTAGPLLIIAIIIYYSLTLLYFVERVPETKMTLKVTGHQWYWEYAYPDQGGITFNSYPVADKDLKPGQPRLLETDNAVVLPTNTPIKVEIAAADVLHAFAIPAFGVKKDAVPGRLNDTWMTIEKEGTFYGQCSELCGAGHAYMPIEIEAVSPEKFASWVSAQQKAQGIAPAAAEKAAEKKATTPVNASAAKKH